MPWTDPTWRRCFGPSCKSCLKGKVLREKSSRQAPKPPHFGPRCGSCGVLHARNCRRGQMPERPDMATLRLLLALLLMALGTAFGALAISGYYEPHMPHGQLVTAPNIAPQPIEKPRLNVWLPKQGLMTAEEPSAKVGAKP